MGASHARDVTAKGWAEPNQIRKSDDRLLFSVLLSTHPSLSIDHLTPITTGVICPIERFSDHSRTNAEAKDFDKGSFWWEN